MSQTTYNETPDVAVAGLIDGLVPRTVETSVNKTAAAIPFGVAVKESAEQSCILPAAAADKLLGVVCHEHLEATSSTGSAGVPVNKAASILRKGRIHVVVENAINRGADVYVRHTANGSGKLQCGAFRADADSGNCRRVMGARVITGTSGAGVALVEVDFLADAVGMEASGQGTAGTAPGYVELTPGTEGSNAIDVVGQLRDSNGEAIAEAREVLIRSLAVTDHKGDLAAATTAVGTVVKTNNPATGANEQWMTTSATGAFSFKVANDVAEVTLVQVLAEGCKPRNLKLTFA